ncbi:MAG: hypothetical protein M3Q45_12565 [Chloroflexota bacterium]|nr:hypothetical protein [Chloroflexota bacterium]
MAHAPITVPDLLVRLRPLHAVGDAAYFASIRFGFQFALLLGAQSSRLRTVTTVAMAEDFFDTALPIPTDPRLNRAIVHHEQFGYRLQAASLPQHTECMEPLTFLYIFFRLIQI